ncbi:CDP-alcohol phosphatidyltransferase family protein [Ignicoccus hospitalis]|nr:CDP-alcohol phosphatidyltransferase family protein [Ignicoccus hospitalis]HIH90918.1 CDP-alcohol phosphatidyltransferase family protein [Desulfurococcaceae archaeon]
MEKLRGRTEGLLKLAARPLSKLSPNVITLLSIPFAATFTYLVWKGMVLEALPFLLLSTLFDALDGAVARLTGKTSKAGAFLDSAVDRLNDTIIFYSLPALGVPWTVTYLWITGSIIISSVRAAAESEGVALAGKGIMERGDRLLALFSLILVYLIEQHFTTMENFRYVPAVAAGITALIWLTIAQRLYYSNSLRSFWVGFNLSAITIVLFFYGWWDPVGTLGVSGGLALVYLILKVTALGEKFPLSKADSVIDSAALLSFIVGKGLASWLLWFVRCCYYFKILRGRRT